MAGYDISVTIHISVHDEEAFRNAAMTQALEDGLSEVEATAYLSSHSLEECAVMILDPGLSPDGCSIECSEAV